MSHLCTMLGVVGMSWSINLGIFDRKYECISKKEGQRSREASGRTRQRFKAVMNIKSYETKVNKKLVHFSKWSH